jgi:ATP-binding cassette subfamily B protein
MDTLKRSSPTLSNFLVGLIKPYKGLISTMAVIGLIWAFINTLLPFTLKLIIDHVVGYQGDKSNLFETTLPYVAGYIALWLGLCVNMRVLDWVKLKLFPNLREDVMTRMFSYLNQHSHHYFQNNFAGSLVNKILDMQSGVIAIFTTLDDLYAQTLGISVAIIILLLIHPIFAAILIGWAAAFLLITFI